MKKTFAALVLCCAMVAQSYAGSYLDGNKLYGYLMSSSDLENTHAWGYIAGISDAYNGGSHCIPAGVSVGQLRDIVKNFLASTPEVRHRPADLIVYAVLKNTYPCAEKKKGKGGA